MEGTGRIDKRQHETFRETPVPTVDREGDSRAPYYKLSNLSPKDKIESFCLLLNKLPLWTSGQKLVG